MTPKKDKPKKVIYAKKQDVTYADKPKKGKKK